MSWVEELRTTCRKSQTAPEVRSPRQATTFLDLSNSALTWPPGPAWLPGPIPSRDPPNPRRTSHPRHSLHEADRPAVPPRGCAPGGLDRVRDDRKRIEAADGPPGTPRRAGRPVREDISPGCGREDAAWRPGGDGRGPWRIVRHSCVALRLLSPVIGRERIWRDLGFLNRPGS